jgi:heme/copper-type cytochrome/quinol oxidase subunit 3
LGLVFFVLRYIEFATLPFRWDSSAYGSVFWTLAGLHTLHALAACAENVMLLVLLFRGPLEEKHLVDLSVNTLYWYFVVAAWLPSYAILFLDPLLFSP